MNRNQLYKLQTIEFLIETKWKSNQLNWSAIEYIAAICCTGCILILGFYFSKKGSASFLNVLRLYIKWTGNKKLQFVKLVIISKTIVLLTLNSDTRVASGVQTGNPFSHTAYVKITRFLHRKSPKFELRAQVSKSNVLVTFHPTRESTSLTVTYWHC